jgi:signal transduction histidine kinase
MLAKNLSHSPESLKGENIFDLLRFAGNGQRKRKFMEVAEKKVPVIFEDRFWGKYYVLHIYPIADGGNMGGRIAVFAMDVTELKLAEQHIRSLSQELIRVQETERQKISRDLHDNVAQELASLKIGCDMLFDHPDSFDAGVVLKVQKFSKILQNSIMSVRNIAYDLMPPGLDHLGIVRTIANYCDEFTEQNGIPVDFFAAGMSELQLKPETEINLYRIVQEALHNIKKHSGSDQVVIRMTVSFPNIILRIEDKGKGFNLKDRLESSMSEKRMGLRSMKERALLLNGTLDILSQEGKGTRIMVEIPILDNTKENTFGQSGDDNEPEYIH